MKQLITVFCLAMLLNACSSTAYYIVRHAEKATAAPGMSNDVPLTDKGKDRASKLKDLLSIKNIGYIFSTQTIRTTSTAKPLSEAISIPIEIYNPRDTSDVFINQLKAIQKKNVLIVGHSSTVDDLVNKLTGKQLLSDLPDSSYSNLFIVKKAGRKYKFSRKIYEP
ncbi:MAG: histidine phosphatase family protein [Chitinophagaceae bacterium]|nr:histidine phosphatase family protein [Chitinophagaceae bacterium]